MQCFVGASQDVLHRPEIAARESGHSSRVHVELPEPMDSGQSAPEGVIDLVRVVFVSGIVSGLLRGPPAGARNCEHYAGRIEGFLPRSTEERHAGLASVRSFGNPPHDPIKNVFGNRERLNRFFIPHQSPRYISLRAPAPGQRCLRPDSTFVPARSNTCRLPSGSVMSQAPAADFGFKIHDSPLVQAGSKYFD